ALPAITMAAVAAPTHATRRVFRNMKGPPSGHRSNGRRGAGSGTPRAVYRSARASNGVAGAGIAWVPRGRDNSGIEARKRALIIALAANAAFLGVELVGGFVFGSLALLADGAH